MKKIFCAIMLMLLIAGSAYAQATFSLTGSYWAEGKYWFNYNAGPGTDATYNENSFGFYEQDINLFPKISIGNTSLNFQVAITDTYWGAVAADTTEGITQDDRIGGEDDDIQIERAYLSHKFGDKLILDVGLMDGTQFGTTFADDKQAKWRVKATAFTPVGVIGAVLEKNKDRGAFSTGDDVPDNFEGEDSDAYGLFAVTKAGSVYIKPLLWYVRNQHIFMDKTADLSALGAVIPDPRLTDDADLEALLEDVDLNLFNPVLAFNGDLGALSFEAEFNYKMWEIEGGTGNVDEDWDTYGIYVNIWKALDAMTPGFVAAYGSYDEDLIDAANAALAAGNYQAFITLNGVAANAAFDFEDDFNSTVILGDEYCWGGPGDDLQGMTLLKLYVNDIKTGMDPLTLSAYAAYVMSNQDDTLYEDATAWELGLGTAYKITDNLVYSIYGAYADIDYDVTGFDDPDSVYMIANAIEFAF